MITINSLILKLSEMIAISIITIAVVSLFVYSSLICCYVLAIVTTLLLLSRLLFMLFFFFFFLRGLLVIS